MLDDRDYMRRRPEPENRFQTGRTCVFTLIAINVVMFILTGSPKSEQILMLSVDGLRNGMFWQLLTAMFMHDGFSHIFFNMWGLYVFGGIVAPRLGGRAFLALYLAAGLAGNVLEAAALWNTPQIMLCGASGAVMGITAAAAVMAPETPMLLIFIPFPIKLRTMAIVFFALEIVLQLSGGQSYVAHMAHLGGLLAGYVYLKLFFRREILWDPLESVFGRRRYRPPKDDAGGSASAWTYRRSPDRDPDYGPNFSTDSSYGFNGTRVSRHELDYLLDKISRTGINSLTPQELQRLKQAREEMRRS